MKNKGKKFKVIINGLIELKYIHIHVNEDEENHFSYIQSNYLLIKTDDREKKKDKIKQVFH